MSTRASFERNGNALNDITNGLPNRSKSTAKENTKRGLSVKGPGGIKTECVRVRCRNWDQTRSSTHPLATSTLEKNEEGENEEGDAGSEMIWWSWDGKLEGFSDW